MIVNVIIFVTVAVLGGLGSSWLMIDKGSRLTTKTYGPWVTWTAAGRADADPYTRAHFLRRGILPQSTAFTQTFQSTTDSGGALLHSSCEYAVDGDEPQGTFWSFAVFDDKGRLIPNPADRHAFNSASIVRAPNGGLDIALSRNARAGNWLPTGGAGRLTLQLAVEEARPPATGDDGWRLPNIRRLACR